jgi:tetratricopeptide (TPR) repeat protein
MKSCPQCNHPVAPDDAFCDECGTKLNGSPAPSDEALENIEDISRDRLNGVSPALLLSRVQRFLSQQPGHVTGWVILGNFQRDLQHLEDAETAYVHALRLDPRSCPALQGLGSVHRRRKHYDRAMECYRQIVEIDPGFAQVYASMAIVELARYRDREALEFARRAYTLDNSDSVIVANLAAACHYNGAHVERDKLYLECQKLNYPNMEKLSGIISGELTVRDPSCAR